MSSMAAIFQDGGQISKTNYNPVITSLTSNTITNYIKKIPQTVLNNILQNNLYLLTPK